MPLQFFRYFPKKYFSLPFLLFRYTFYVTHIFLLIVPETIISLFFLLLLKLRKVL